MARESTGYRMSKRGTTELPEIFPAQSAPINRLYIWRAPFPFDFWSRFGAEKLGAPQLFQPRNCDPKLGQAIRIDVKKTAGGRYTVRG